MESTTQNAQPAYGFGETPAEQIAASFEWLRSVTFDALAVDIDRAETALRQARAGVGDHNLLDANTSVELARLRLALRLIGEGATRTLLDSLAQTGLNDDPAFYLRNTLIEALGLPEETDPDA